MERETTGRSYETKDYKKAHKNRWMFGVVKGGTWKSAIEPQTNMWTSIWNRNVCAHSEYWSRNATWARLAYSPTKERTIALNSQRCTNTISPEGPKITSGNLHATSRATETASLNTRTYNRTSDRSVRQSFGECIGVTIYTQSKITRNRTNQTTQSPRAERRAANSSKFVLCLINLSAQARVRTKWRIHIINIHFASERNNNNLVKYKFDRFLLLYSHTFAHLAHRQTSNITSLHGKRGLASHSHFTMALWNSHIWYIYMSLPFICLF